MNRLIPCSHWKWDSRFSSWLSSWRWYGRNYNGKEAYTVSEKDYYRNSQDEKLREQ